MLRLQSGFELDYANIYNESCIQERDVNNFERAIQNVWRHTNILRSTGFEEGHVSKDGLPEPVLFYQLPYISEDGINTPAMLKRWRCKAVCVHGCHVRKAPSGRTARRIYKKRRRTPPRD